MDLATGKPFLGLEKKNLLLLTDSSRGLPLLDRNYYFFVTTPFYLGGRAAKEG